VSVEKFPDCKMVHCEASKISPEYALDSAKFIGLPTNYEEGLGRYFAVYTYPNVKAIGHVVYRYKNSQVALSAYQEWLGSVDKSPLSRITPIVRRYDKPYNGVNGHIIETADPAGVAYWFVGVYNELLTAVVMLEVKNDDEKYDKMSDHILSVVLDNILEWKCDPDCQ